MKEKPSICFVMSTLMTAKAFLDNHIKELSADFDIYVVANISETDNDYLHSLPVKGYKHIEIERDIRLGSDLKALVKLTRYLREEKFLAVHSVTPKAGLIAAMASKFASIQNRIHIFTGQVWSTKKGLFKTLLKTIDKIIVALNTHVLVDGHSQKEFLIEQRVLNGRKALVLADGSIAGVDTNKFSPDIESRKKIRNEIGLRDNQIVFVFLGRLNKDKGIDELIGAFSLIQQKYDDTFLLLVGPDEGNYKEIIKADYPNLKEKQNYLLYGLTSAPEKLLNAGDVFCLPSYREGFGVSVIEASSVGLPVIISDTYGLRDSILPEVTGLVCKAQDVDSLYSQMKYLMENPSYRKLLGVNGRGYIQKSFNQADVSKAWVDFYLSLK